MCTTTQGSFQFNSVSVIPDYSTFVSINESNFIRLLYIRGNNNLPHSSAYHGTVCAWPLGEGQALKQYSWLNEGPREHYVFFFRKMEKNMGMLISLNIILMFQNSEISIKQIRSKTRVKNYSAFLVTPYGKLNK